MLQLIWIKGLEYTAKVTQYGWDYTAGVYYHVTKKSGGPNFLEGEGQALELPASSIRKHVICWLLARAIEVAVSAAQSLGPCLLKEVSQHSDPTQVPDYFELGGLESPRDFTSDIWKSVEREA